MISVRQHGEENLDKLLRTLSPELVGGEFVFCSFQKDQYGDHSELEPIAVISEKEGLTLVIPQSKADKYHHQYKSVFRCITLNVHSSLTAVGLTAVFANKLAEHGISANVIAGYFHDHIFVISEFADKAIAALLELTAQQSHE